MRKDFGTNEVPMRKNFGPTKYPREKILDTQITQEKKFWTYKIPTRKNFGPTKYTRKKILNRKNCIDCESLGKSKLSCIITESSRNSYRCEVYLKEL